MRSPETVEKERFFVDEQGATNRKHDQISFHLMKLNFELLKFLHQARNSFIGFLPMTFCF